MVQMSCTLWNVERITSHGTSLYLAHIPGCGMEWTTDSEQAFSYDDEAEAHADADAHGGEVSAFQRPFSRRDVPTFTLIAAE